MWEAEQWKNTFAGRDGKKDLRFRGVVIAEQEVKPLNAKSWECGRIYRTDKDNYVGTKETFSDSSVYPKRKDYCRSDDPQEILKFFFGKDGYLSEDTKALFRKAAKTDSKFSGLVEDED